MSFIEIIIFTVFIAIIIAVTTLIFNRKLIPNINSDRDIKEILASGNRLKAIKAYRQLHGVGLKKAKQSIDQMT